MVANSNQPHNNIGWFWISPEPTFFVHFRVNTLIWKSYNWIKENCICLKRNLKSRLLTSSRIWILGRESHKITNWRPHSRRHQVIQPESLRQSRKLERRRFWPQRNSSAGPGKLKDASRTYCTFVESTSRLYRWRMAWSHWIHIQNRLSCWNSFKTTIEALYVPVGRSGSVSTHTLW